MKKTLAGFALALAVVIFPQTVLAVTIDSPADGSSVGNSFTITGTYGPSVGDSNECNVGPLGVQGYEEFVNPQGLSFNEANKTFKYIVNVKESLTTDGQQPNPPVYIKPGEVTFIASSIAVPENGECKTDRVTLNVGPQVKAASAEPTATPTPTSTVTPTPVEAETSEGWFDNLDPVLVLLIGAIAGGGATGLAEYSWIRHRRKHGK
ncbi:MAG: hypothetical protein Q8Q11_01945 [bacterium]|nr:hypothetical protein [bacterium]MDZ4247896.1 hypothetical protein [Patescibacteria group bacterium]